MTWECGVKYSDEWKYENLEREIDNPCHKL
jgi:hypothetical protein